MGSAVRRPAAFASPSALTFRKSTSSVSGLGRVATYGTGALASITSVAPPRRGSDEMAVRRGDASDAGVDTAPGPPADPLDIPASMPASVNETSALSPFGTVIP